MESPGTYHRSGGSSETKQYDNVGNQIAIVDKRGATTLMRYDAKNRLVETEESTGATTRLGYDERGNITQLSIRSEEYGPMSMTLWGGS